jgi:hypothetical protein
MSFDQSLARCSFCGRHTAEVRRMVAGPGAAYICDECLQLCNEIMQDPTPFSTKALELASRPPVVIAAPLISEENRSNATPGGTAERILQLELEQKQLDMTLILHQLCYYAAYFELRYLWIRPPLTSGFAFVPRIIFLLQDNLGNRWHGERGGTLLARPELASGLNQTVYQGNARFRPLPAPEARALTVQAVDPLSLFNNPTPQLWRFEIGL